jgi:two-component system response regulator NreC
VSDIGDHDAVRASSGAADTFTVMCIDDNALLIDALERRLAYEEGFAGMYRAHDDFAGAADRAIIVQPDIVLLDIDLPDGVDSLELLAEMVRNTPTSRVIVFTGYPDAELVNEALGLGAWGFVSKGVPSERVIAAIQSVRRGEAVIAIDE